MDLNIRLLALKLGLDHREQELVVLLAAGHTDDTAARHMNIHPRTVSNLMRAMMDRCGVNNRFQFGLVLGAAGVPGVPGVPAPAAPGPGAR